MLITIVSVILGIIMIMLYLKVVSKYGYARLWTGVKEQPNIVPIDPQTGKVLRVGDKVRIAGSNDTFIYRDSLNDKRCICRNEQTGEIIEATLDEMYFQDRPSTPSLPDEQKKDLHVCIHYPELYTYKDAVSRINRVGGGSNRIKNELYYILRDYAPKCHIYLGKTPPSLENYFFYNDLYKSLRSGNDPQDVELDTYADDLSYSHNTDDTVNHANLLIIVGDASSAPIYVATAKQHNIETFFIQ